MKQRLLLLQQTAPQQRLELGWRDVCDEGIRPRGEVAVTVDVEVDHNHAHPVIVLGQDGQTPIRLKCSGIPWGQFAAKTRFQEFCRGAQIYICQEDPTLPEVIFLLSFGEWQFECESHVDQLRHFLYFRFDRAPWVLLNENRPPLAVMQ